MLGMMSLKPCRAGTQAELALAAAALPHEAKVSRLLRSLATTTVVAALSLLIPLDASPASVAGIRLGLGSRGAAVTALQRALERASYPAGSIDGRFGPKTEQAVIAFQKVHRLARTGVVSAREDQAILRARRQAPPRRKPAHYVYVNLARQVLFEVHRGVVRGTIPVSSGGGYTYQSQSGATHLALTPTGRFAFYRKTVGWYHSYLGWMYYPSYFDDGYAIHGDTFVPPYPVSHGCIRIPMWLAIGFFRRNPLRTPVFVER
jgi:N-acetylmuramoyl-L-alanine amidase